MFNVKSDVRRKGLGVVCSYCGSHQPWTSFCSTNKPNLVIWFINPSEWKQYNWQKYGIVFLKNIENTNILIKTMK